MQLRKVFTLVACVAAITVSASAYSAVEWTLHKTANGAHPNAHEQQLLWLMNRARANPTAEGQWLASSNEYAVSGGRDYFNVDKNKLRSEFSQIKPTPPAAWDRRLFYAARQHGLNLIARDSQDHSGQSALTTQSGFNWARFRGNVFSYADDALNAHAAFNIDWGVSNDGMQTDRGHRQAIMSTDAPYSNVGLAVLMESNPATSVGQMIVVGNYVQAYTSTGNHFNKFIVGTVYDDRNTNGRYDVGEGVPDVMVIPDVGPYYAITSAGGGYSIPVNSRGQVTVSFAGSNAVDDYKTTVQVGDQSVLLDYVANVDQYNEDVFPSLTLNVDGAASGSYGFNWGANSNPVNVMAQFGKTNHDVALRIRGYNVVRGDEVEVFLNGQSLGHLAPQPDALGPIEWFLITPSMQTNWNEIEIRQRTPGKKWGIAGLQLKSVPGDTLPRATIGSPNTARYGKQNRYFGSVKVPFYAKDRDLVLSLNGYDVNHSREVGVYVNGRLVRYLRPGQSNRVAPFNLITIRGDQLESDGNNLIEFRVDVPWAMWGVQNVLLRDVTPDEPYLSFGSGQTGLYGINYGSASMATVRARFVSSNQDVRIRYEAFHVNSDREVAIYLNGNFVEFVSPTGTSGRHWRVVDLSASQQRNGTNSITFVRANPVGAWGIGRMDLIDVTRPTLTLQPKVTLPGIFGLRIGNPEETTHPSVLRARFNLARQPTELTFRGWEINAGRELEVYLNNHLIGRVTPSPAVASSINRIDLPLGQQAGGWNEIEFRMTSASDFRWGVSGLRVLPKDDNGSSGIGSPLNGAGTRQAPSDSQRFRPPASESMLTRSDATIQ